MLHRRDAEGAEPPPPTRRSSRKGRKGEPKDRKEKQSTPFRGPGGKIRLLTGMHTDEHRSPARPCKFFSRKNTSHPQKLTDLYLSRPPLHRRGAEGAEGAEPPPCPESNMFTQRAQIKNAPQIHTETDQMEERHAEATKENPKIAKKNSPRRSEVRVGKSGS